MRLDEAGLRSIWRRWFPGEADAVIGRHREPHRSYHGVRHLCAVVGDLVDAGPESPDLDLGTLLAAAFFHDAVYDPRSSTNEADSAALARRSLDGAVGWPSGRVEEVSRLILLTREHSPAADDVSGQLLCDVDLAVLGAEPAVYEAYRRGVRAEYAHVDDAAWRVGRRTVLESFLQRDEIFRTTRFGSRESRARANLVAELSSLDR